MVFQDASSITSVAFSKRYKQIITSSLNNKAVLWDIESGQIVRMFTGHDSGSIVTSVAVNECMQDEMLLLKDSICSEEEMGEVVRKGRKEILSQNVRGRGRDKSKS